MEFLTGTMRKKGSLIMNKTIMDLYFICFASYKSVLTGNLISMETKMSLEFPRIYLRRVSGVQPMLKLIYLQIIFSLRKTLSFLKSALGFF